MNDLLRNDPLPPSPLWTVQLDTFTPWHLTRSDRVGSRALCGKEMDWTDRTHAEVAPTTREAVAAGTNVCATCARVLSYEQW